jgi:hypothetical protein
VVAPPDVFDIRHFFDQAGDLVTAQRGIRSRVLQDDRPVKFVCDPVEHIHGDGSIRARRRHGDDGVRAGSLRPTGEKAHLRHGNARTAEYYWQSPVDRLQHGLQVAQALFLAQQVELAHHDRPDDAVLPAAAAEISRACRSEVRIS